MRLPFDRASAPTLVLCSLVGSLVGAGCAQRVVDGPIDAGGDAFVDDASRPDAADASTDTITTDSGRTDSGITLDFRSCADRSCRGLSRPPSGGLS